MSIASEITRIAGLRDTIRSKLLDFGIITDSAAKLSACSEAIEGIDEAALAVPSLSITSNPTIDNATGLVSVSGNASGTVSASEGYSKGLSKSISVPVSGSLQLATQGEQTITPGTSNKIIAANRWLTGAQTIKGDSNLVAANILSGKSIFGVSGSLVEGKKILTGTISNFYSNTYKTFTYTWPGSGTRSLECVPVTLNGISPTVVLAVSIKLYSSTSYSIAHTYKNPTETEISTYQISQWYEVTPLIKNDVLYIPTYNLGYSSDHSSCTFYYTIIGD